MSLDQTAFVLGALTATGGTIGFIRTGSMPSIAAGLTVGALYAFSGMRLRSRQPYGVEAGLLASVVLAGSSLPRAIKLQKPVPMALSALALLGAYRFGMAFAGK